MERTLELWFRINVGWGVEGGVAHGGSGDSWTLHYDHLTRVSELMIS